MASDTSLVAYGRIQAPSGAAEAVLVATTLSHHGSWEQLAHASVTVDQPLVLDVAWHAVVGSSLFAALTLRSHLGNHVGSSLRVTALRVRCVLGDDDRHPELQRLVRLHPQDASAFPMELAEEATVGFQSSALPAIMCAEAKGGTPSWAMHCTCALTLPGGTCVEKDVVIRPSGADPQHPSMHAPLSPAPEFEVVLRSIPSDVFVGEPCNIEFDFVHRGRVPVAVTVCAGPSAEGDGIIVAGRDEDALALVSVLTMDRIHPGRIQTWALPVLPLVGGRICVLPCRIEVVACSNESNISPADARPEMTAGAERPRESAGREMFMRQSPAPGGDGVQEHGTVVLHTDRTWIHAVARPA